MLCYVSKVFHSKLGLFSTIYIFYILNNQITPHHYLHPDSYSILYPFIRMKHVINSIYPLNN